MTRNYFYIAFVLFLACTPKGQSKSPSTPKPATESTLNILQEALQQTGVCSPEKAEIIQANEALLIAWIDFISSQLSQTWTFSPSTPIDIGPMAAQYYKRSDQATLGNDLVGIVKSENFAQMRNDTADWLRGLANNQDLLDQLVRLKEALDSDAGASIESLFKILATHRVAQRDLLSSLKVFSCPNPSDQDITNSLYLPGLLHEMEPHISSILVEPLLNSLFALQKYDLNPPGRLIAFLNLAQQHSNRSDICSISSLKPYRPFLQTLAFLAAEHRGIRLLDLMIQIMSLNDADHCQSRGIRQIESKDLSDFLLRLAHLLAT
ncbi:MAG: hypothetical protein I8H75_03795 [Myxococcaceae bacterium]|nr:hypothetical protein [Myxococcaceae bacterium]MBH2006450.1 hypothetical protein [Myxococcaceae bacterium]